MAEDCAKIAAAHHQHCQTICSARYSGIEIAKEIRKLAEPKEK
jgi:hypothetical protein